MNTSTQNTTTTSTTSTTSTQKENTMTNVLTTTASEFAQMAHERAEVARGRGDSMNKEIMSLGWDLRKGLTRKRSEIEGLFALQYVKALDTAKQTKGGESAIRAAVLEAYHNMRGTLPQVADVIENMYNQYESHAQALVGMTGYSYELSPFQRVITNIQQADAQEVSLDWLLEDEELGSLDEETRAAYEAYAAVGDIEQSMNQADLRKHKENNQIIDAKDKNGGRASGISTVYETIDRETFLDDRTERDMNEWEIAASSGAWLANVRIMTTTLSKYPSLRDQLSERRRDQEVTFKTLIPFMVRLRSKGVDASIALKRMNDYRDHLEAQDAKVREFVAMPQSDQYIELLGQITEMERNRDLLATINEPILANESYMNLDNPLAAYTTYADYDVTAETLAKLNTAYHKLFKANVKVESFDTEEGVLFSISIAQGLKPELVELIAGTVAQVRYEHNKMAKIHAQVLRTQQVMDAMPTDAPTTADADAYIDSLI